jgi:hypothetical protein
MQVIQSPKTYTTWYLSNLAGWILGLAWIAVFSIALDELHLYRFEEGSYIPYIIYYTGSILEPVIILVPPILCVLFAQRLMLRQWQVKFGVYQWIAANMKGAFIAFVVLALIGGLVGKFQRPILDTLYGNHTYGAQTPFIFSFISVMVPLLGSIGTSIVIAIDIFGWRFGKSDLVE